MLVSTNLSKSRFLKSPLFGIYQFDVFARFCDMLYVGQEIMDFLFTPRSLFEHFRNVTAARWPEVGSNFSFGQDEFI